MGLRVWKRGHGPEVSGHSHVWGVWNSAPGLWSALGRKSLDNSVFAAEVLGRCIGSFSLIPFLTIFLPVTLEYFRLSEGWFNLSRPSLPGVIHPRHFPSRL